MKVCSSVVLVFEPYSNQMPPSARAGPVSAVGPNLPTDRRVLSANCPAALRPVLLYLPMIPPLNLLAAPHFTVPQLETADLLLRGPRITDLPEYAAMLRDPACYRFIGGQPVDEENTWRRMLAQQGHWALLGYGSWTVAEKATGRFVGTVGFFDVQRDLTPSIKGTPEAGWVLAAHAHGRGYATQAVQAAHAWADVHFPAGRTVCIIDPGNEASLRVAAKFGYHEFARSPYHGEEIVLLERFRTSPPGPLS